MNAGYSSGWCEESFGIRLVAVEIQCVARGDNQCKFIMAPPGRIIGRINEYQTSHPDESFFVPKEIPGFFERRSNEEASQKKAFNDLKKQHLALQSEREKVINLLRNMFPEPIVEKMQLGQEIVAQRHTNATVLFADVVDFTNTASQLDPECVLNWLNSLFCAIDRLTDKYQLEKVKTIGDAYMLAGGVSMPREDHVEAVLSFALDLVEELKTLKDPQGNQCRMRIGICTGGSVCSGVIGKKKFVFDIWGDCVNVASRMQALGEPGKVHCTESVKRVAEKSFVFEDRGTIEVKGKGPLRCYFCVGKKSLSTS
jgi:class 3 adenylate cyclase